MLTSSFSSALAAIYPAERLLTAPVQLLAYESDALTAFRRRPQAVVLAESQDEVIRTVRLCHEAGVPFVARGSGTSLSGGSLPIEDGIVIGLNRLNRIRRLDPQQRLAVVEPGVVNQQITSAAEPYGLYYAPDPSSQSVCTIGGNIAFNSGGAHCLKYGMTSNHILALRVVLADGEVVEFGSDSAEGVGVGPDWVGLFVGSEGLFGIALEATVRLVPKPERYRTVLAAYRDLAAAGQAVAAVVASGLLPAAIEIMDRLAIDAAEAAVGAGYPRAAEAVLIVELDGEAAQVEREFEHLQQVIAQSGASQIRVAQSSDERLKIWKGRKGAFSAVGRLSPDYVVQDGVVPRGQLGRALAEIGRLSGEYGLRVANVFHAGDGNLHPLILYDGRQAGALERAEELAGKIVQLCIELGGTITGEHGVGMEKRRYMRQLFQPVDLDAMRRIRRQLDPLEIANRGKMFPEDADGPISRPGPAEGAEERPALAPRPNAPQAAAVRPDSPGSVLQPQSTAELQQMVAAASGPLRVRGGGSKPALSTPPEGAACLDVSRLSGMQEYVPDEYTFTAYAGTPVLQVAEELARHGQYLPFDPLLVRRGATLGGTVAANTSGSGRYRYGGVRDFILGVQFVDGRGQLVRSGGKVVKNAAGFDLPKFFVGSLGRYGVLVSASFKVFPRPRSYRSCWFTYPSLAAAQQALLRLATQPLEIEALDLEPEDGATFQLWVRLGGIEAGMAERLERVRSVLQEDQPPLASQVLQGGSEAAAWELHNGLVAWAPAGAELVKIPMAPRLLPDLEQRFGDIPRRYTAGGHVAWIAAEDIAAVDRALTELGLAGLRLFGPPGNPYLGGRRGASLAARLKRALDPSGKFGEA